jgi:hypothetical protein
LRLTHAGVERRFRPWAQHESNARFACKSNTHSYAQPDAELAYNADNAYNAGIKRRD